MLNAALQGIAKSQHISTIIFFRVHFLCISLFRKMAKLQGGLNFFLPNNDQTFDN